MNVSELDFSVLAPLAFTSAAAMGVLLLEAAIGTRGLGASQDDDVRELARHSRVRTLLAVIASIALVLSIYTAAYMFVSGAHSAFNPLRPMLQLDLLSTYSIALIGLAALLCVWLSITYLPALHINHGEYYALLLLSVSGMFLMVSAVDLMALFVGIELTNIPLYVLAGFDRRKLRSNEAALKYFLTGAVASALFLYGDPIRVPREAGDADEQRLQAKLEAELDRVTDLADEQVGMSVEEARPAVES